MTEQLQTYKEMIYIDQLELDSALAQINQGLKESIQESNSSNETVTSTNKKDVTAKGGLSLFAKVELDGSYSSETGQANGEAIGQNVTVVLNDYKVELLIDSLSASQNFDLKRLASSANDGDFVLLDSQFSLLDFNFIQEVLDAKALKTLMKAIPDENGTTSWNKNIESGFKLMQSYAALGDTFFKDNVIIRTNNAIAYSEKNNFRMNSAQLQQISGTTRNVKVLGIVESSLGSDKNNIDVLTQAMKDGGNLSTFGNVAPALSETIIESSGIAKKGDKLIKPIAVYF
ncbi:hypothetical protein HCY98_06860 [Limosilactobacillus fermentum]